MKGKSHKTEEIIRILRMADRGKIADDVCREVNICSDNGSEFIAKEVQHWLREMGIRTIYIDPGNPWSRGRRMENFHNRLRDERLNQALFPSVTETRCH